MHFHSFFISLYSLSLYVSSTDQTTKSITNFSEARAFQKNLNLNYVISLILIKFLNCSFKRQAIIAFLVSIFVNVNQGIDLHDKLNRAWLEAAAL